MSSKFDRNSKTISEIYHDFTAGTLQVDSSYQRRKVWNTIDNIKLIETILMEFVIPEVFFWDAQIDPETGKTLTNIVDGQQRINAIVSFLEGEFSLTEKYLKDETVKSKYKNKFFSELSPEAKTLIWSYSLPIVKLNKSFTYEDIRTIFYRLNLTNYALNNQEKSRSEDSAFIAKCEQLALHDFWKNKKIFSSNDFNRMKDIEFCGGIYILAVEGIVNQTSYTKMNEYKETYQNSFDENDIFYDKINNAMEFIDEFLDNTTSVFLFKKTQMYSMFSLYFKLISEKIYFSDDLFIRFKFFVKVYSVFKKEYPIGEHCGEVLDYYEKIRKYKELSSQGVNSYLNRIERLKILYEIVVNEKTLHNLNELYVSFSSLHEDNNLFESFDDEYLTDLEYDS